MEKIDIDLWQRIQDTFSKTLGVPLLSFDVKGKVIALSGELPFYIELMQSKNPALLPSLEGLKIIKKPLFLYGNEFGSVVVPVGADENSNFALVAGKMGIDFDEARDAALEVKNLPLDQIEEKEKILSLFAEMIPQLAFQTQKTENQLTELNSLYKLIRKVNSTLDLEEVLKYIMQFLVDSLKCANCSVFVLDNDEIKKYYLYGALPHLQAIEETAAKRVMEQKRPLTLHNLREKFNVEVEESYNSLVSLPLINRNKILGAVNLYGSEVNPSSHENLDFLLAITDQAAMAISNAKQFEEVKELAIMDKLTGAYTRRHFTQLLEEALKKDISVENPLGLILLDIDFFGKFNNTHGHPQGDKLLQDLTSIIKENLRDEDCVGRYGGEEFILMIPGATPQLALEISEKIKTAIAEYPFEGRETQPGGKVTVSCGLCVTRANVSMNEFVKETDEALYKAKNSGKNKVVQKIILAGNLKAEI